MAGRFPLLADASVNDHLVRALLQLGWDVARAIDLYPEKTQDEVLFERAARDGRVFVTNDRPAEAIAIRWLRAGRAFRAMVAWPQEDYARRTIGDLVQDFESLAREENPFEYPIRYLKASDGP